MTMPTWISEVQAFGGPVVAAAAVYLATKQVHIARQKLRLDLYPARYRVYAVVLGALVEALNQSHQSTLDKTTIDLNGVVREARFLFSSSVFTYLLDLETAVLQYRSVSLALKSGAGRSPPDDWQRQTEWHRITGSYLLRQLQELSLRLADHLRVDDEVSLTRDVMVRGGEPPRPEL